MLAVIMCASCFTGCKKRDEDDKGAEINMYIANMPYDLDPTRIQYDSENLKFYSLIYESLFRINEKGKLENALVKEAEIEEDERTGEIKLILELKNTKWSDGVSVTADDVVYAFKRILDPGTNNPAAALLFPIENAKAAKSGLMTIDDVGFSAISSKKVEIVFEDGFTDIEYFKRSLASPMFTPLREDIVLQNKEEWAQAAFVKDVRNKKTGGDSYSTIVTNGPFVVKEWTKDSIILERSVYYGALDPEADVTKFVTPYRIKLSYASGSKLNNDESADAQLENFNIGKDDENHIERNFFIGNFSKEGYEGVKGDVETFADASMYTYYFNANNKVLSDARVRKALSIALDRNKIAEIVGLGVAPATGYVPTGIEADNKGKKEYRDEASDVISASADVSKAKSLLSEAKVTKGTINILIRDDRAWEAEIADYVKGVWSSLGFTVNITKESCTSEEAGQYISPFETKLTTGDFDVVGVDMCAISSDAYSYLAPFAREFSGSVVSVDDDAEPSTPHITGFDNAEYNELIEGLLTAENAAGRLAIYKQAEAILAEEVPTAPLFFGVNNYLVSGELSKISYNNNGAPIFTKTKLKNYDHYKLVIEKSEDSEETEE